MFFENVWGPCLMHTPCKGCAVRFIYLHLMEFYVSVEVRGKQQLLNSFS